MIPDPILASYIAIVGKTGSGKTYAAKGLVERLLTAGKRVCVIDPTGVWWGLRSQFPVAIFGGEHADIHLTASSPGPLAALIGDRNLPAVVDLSEMLIGERHRFMEVFAAELFRHNRTPLHLVIDEADEFAPQNPLPETKRMLHHIDRIVRRGRVRGFRPWLITQRPAVLHKNVLTQADTMIAMRLTGPQDRAAVQEWVKGHGGDAAGKEVLSSLASLKRGEGWVWAPNEDILKRMTFPVITTADTSRTPEDGDLTLDAILGNASLKEVDLGLIRAALAESTAEASKDDPKVLQTRISELEKQLRARGDVATAEGLELAQREGYERARLELAPAVDGSVDEWARRIRAAGADLVAVAEELERREKPTRDSVPLTLSSRRAVPDRAGNAAAPQKAQSSGGAELRILRAIASRHPVKLTIAQWAVLAGMKRTGGTWSTYVSRLRTAGYIQQDDAKLVRVTASGLQAAGKLPKRPRAPDEVIAMWKQALGGGCARMIDVIVAVHPSAISKVDLGRRLEMTITGGTFNTYLSRLRSNGLVVGSDQLRASDALWK